MLLALSGYYDSPKSSQGQSCQSDWLCYMFGTTLMPAPPPLSTAPGLIFVVSSVLVPWSGVFSFCPYSYSSFRARLKLSPPEKTYLHASVLPEYLGYASIKAQKEYCGFSDLMLDCEVFQGRDWVLIEES